MEQRTYSAQELMQILGISASNFETRLKEAKIPAPFRFGKSRRWSKKKIDEWLDGNSVVTA